MSYSFNIMLETSQHNIGKKIQSMQIGEELSSAEFMTVCIESPTAHKIKAAVESLPVAGGKENLLPTSWVRVF